MTAKRMIDVLGALALSVLTLPVVLLLGSVLAVHLRAWPIFAQERIGRDGRPVTMLKLRTLCPSTLPYALKTEVELDPSPLCRALRRLHLDELPQLWLVLVGAMSLVGPRPKMPDDVEPVDPRYGAERVTVPQGITGLWQISDATDVLPSDAAEFDIFYVRNHTVRLDLWILWRTVAVVLGLHRGARLQDVPDWTLPAHARRPRQVVVSTDLVPSTVQGHQALRVARRARADGREVLLRAPVPRDADGGYRRGYGRFSRRDLVDGIAVRRSLAVVTPGDGLVDHLRRLWFVLTALVLLLPRRLGAGTDVALVLPPDLAASPVVRLLAVGCEVAPAFVPARAAPTSRPGLLPQQVPAGLELSKH